MSYEYIVRSNEAANVLYEKINYVMKNVLMYEVSFTNDQAVGYKIPEVENSWGTDIEVFTSEEGVGFNIIIGNTGEIQREIEKEMCSSGIYFTIEEI